MSTQFSTLPLLIALAVMLGPITEAKRVILFSLPHVANVRTHTNVGRSLTEMGHEAYVCIPQFILDGKMVNVQGIKVIAYGDFLGNTGEKLTKYFVGSFWRNETQGLSDVKDTFSSAQNVVLQILYDKALRAKLKEIKPDIFVVYEAPVVLNLAVLPYILDVPFIFMGPFPDLASYRVPFSPSATACPVIADFEGTDMTFMKRLKTAMCNVAFIFAGNLLYDNNLIAELAPHRPQITIAELARKAELFLVESDYILDFARPDLPNMKFIGGSAPTSGKPLKEPFKSFVEGSKNGVVVVTFGSAVVNIPEQVAKKMESAFQKQDLNVVWRANYSSTDSKKILTSKWVPQNDILAHKNTKLFVSHCGANGQYEALFHGVPILCLPIFGDQPYNAHRSTAKGFGLKGNLMELSDTELAALMKEVSGNPKYRNNIQKASSLFKQLFKVPAKEAAFWIDHVMEYGGSYLRSAGQDMPLYQFLALDVIAFIGLVLFVVVFIIYKLIRCCCGLCCRCCGKGSNGKRTKVD